MLARDADNDDSLDWLVPLPGEFHFTWHAAQAMYTLFYQHLFEWAAREADMEKSMKTPKDMDCTDNIKYIDHFLQLVIKATTQYLCGVFGYDYLVGTPYNEILREWEPKSLGARSHY